MRLVSEIGKIGSAESPPKLSVFLLTYNHECFIEESIRSVLMQETNFPFEILIYDDQSTDKTLSKLQASTAPKNVQIRIFQAEKNLYQQNLLSFAGQQIVMQEANSGYIAYLEGDDFYGDIHKLQMQYDFMDENRDVGFTFHDVIKVAPDGQQLESLIPEGFRKDYSVDELRNFQFAYIHASSVLWRRRDLPWPPELFCCTNNADMILPYVWSQSGRAKFLPGFKPNGYRQTEQGIWSGTAASRKAQLKLQTSLLMMSLHLRNQDLQGAKNVLLQRAAAQINNIFS
jgi:glycosyltransferase involved in cell wall biosynthesis